MGQQWGTHAGSGARCSRPAAGWFPAPHLWGRAHSPHPAPHIRGSSSAAPQLPYIGGRPTTASRSGSRSSTAPNGAQLWGRKGGWGWDPHLWGWGHVTPARPTLMGLGVMGAWPDPHLWGSGSWDPIQTHSYGAMGSWDHFQTHTYGAGGHVTLSRPTLVGLGGMGPHPDP